MSLLQKWSFLPSLCIYAWMQVGRVPSMCRQGKGSLFTITQTERQSKREIPKLKFLPCCYVLESVAGLSGKENCEKWDVEFRAEPDDLCMYLFTWRVLVNELKQITGCFDEGESKGSDCPASVYSSHGCLDRWI